MTYLLLFYEWKYRRDGFLDSLLVIYISSQIALIMNTTVMAMHGISHNMIPNKDLLVSCGVIETIRLANNWGIAPIEETCKLLIKGGKENILKAYEEIKKRLSTF